MDRGRVLAARLIVFVAVFVAVADAPATASPILYTVEHVAADVWRYTYSAEDNVWPESWGFATYFDPELYGELSNASGPTGWSILAFDPYPGDPTECCPPVYGYFDAQAQASGLTRSPFAVDFRWLSPGTTPGDQPYIIYDGLFNEVEGGRTLPAAVPEPSTLLLLSGGLAAAALRARRRRRIGLD